MNRRSTGHEGRFRVEACCGLLLLAALLGLVASVEAGTPTTDPRLSATLVGRLEPGATGRLAVRWDGPEGALLDLWVDLDGDGVPASPRAGRRGPAADPGDRGGELRAAPGRAGRARPDGVGPGSHRRLVRPRQRSRLTADERRRCAWQPGFHVAGLNGEIAAMTGVRRRHRTGALRRRAVRHRRRRRRSTTSRAGTAVAWSALATGLQVQA